ncbi:sugar kinase [Egbenema bharatensis]|uniref:sugar kinase n=1 Tax=Egbenema bharatensis TaxID=3463334 RepID=UPI003A8350E8
MSQRGLFVGLTTLDWLYLADAPPDRNQKIVALDYAMAAGGPATNAAVTFGHLGNTAILLTSLGQHPISPLIQSDLQTWGVDWIDLTPDRLEPLPTSSIIVTQATGERSVISINAVKSQAPAHIIPADILQGVEIVLIDGHQMIVSEEIASRAQAMKIPIVVDGGSWKPGFERVLPYADYVIGSANFHPPGCQTLEDTFSYLQGLEIPHIAITQGDRPIQFVSRGQTGEIPVPKIQAIDTLGAGDVFHGAFCHFIGRSNFATALAESAIVAARSCRSFGTRAWMKSESG